MWGESEEAAAMGNRVPCTTSPVPAQPQMGQQMRVNYRPVTLGSPQPLPQVRGAGEANQGTDSGQRKRGRPKKSMGTDSGQQTPPQQLRGDASDSPTATATEKKPRGRPPGSSTKKKGIEALALGLGSTGSGFRAHVITVETGEDVYAKVMASQQGPRAVCILSAHGALSNVTLAQPHQFGANSEGPYEILTLSGSFMPPDAGAGAGAGGLSAMLAMPDGRVFGGRVAGLLTAASPVQVILGSFTLDDRKLPPKSPNSSASPPSQGTFSRSPAASHINRSSRNVRPVYGALSLPRKL